MIDDETQFKEFIEEAFQNLDPYNDFFKYCLFEMSKEDPDERISAKELFELLR